MSGTIHIIENKINEGENIAVVVSARGNATDTLEDILNKAAKNETYQQQLEAFKHEQSLLTPLTDFSSEFSRLEKLFEGVNLLGDFSIKIKDEVLAQGELLSIKTVSELLNQKGINANPTDARVLLKTDENFGNAQPIINISKENVKKHFKQFNSTTVNVVSGFIASNLKNETTTLGRNGSNYTASLLANYLDAEELQNYTHVNGIFTANPDLVSDAKKIEREKIEEEKRRVREEKQRLKDIEINKQKEEQYRLDEEERKLQYQEQKLKESEQRLKDIEIQRVREIEIRKLKEADEFRNKEEELKLKEQEEIEELKSLKLKAEENRKREEEQKRREEEIRIQELKEQKAKEAKIETKLN